VLTTYAWRFMVVSGFICDDLRQSASPNVI
jgi:hypothetical protein